MWLGSRCITKATAQQNNILKYDGRTGVYLLIPTTINSATITGEEIDEVSITKLCEVESFQLSLAGSVTIATGLGTDIGHNLQYTGGPYPVSFPDTEAKSVMGLSGCYLNGFNLNIEYPNSPAQVGYNFQFAIDCES